MDRRLYMTWIFVAWRKMDGLIWVHMSMDRFHGQESSKRKSSVVSRQSSVIQIHFPPLPPLNITWSMLRFIYRFTIISAAGGVAGGWGAGYRETLGAVEAEGMPSGIYFTASQQAARPLHWEDGCG
jgi:hypothetical protein